MIGDSDNDIIPANKLGMKSIYVNYGYGVLKNDLNASFEASKVEDIKVTWIFKVNPVVKNIYFLKPL